MTPFYRLPYSPVEAMMKRDLLMSQPAEFFTDLCGGRVPTLQEKLQCIEITLQRITSFEVYQNDKYNVTVRRNPGHVHLDISRRDDQVCKDWYDFQQIKNELVGPEYEAVELYPAESRLVNTANQYHLWVSTDPSFRFPFGFSQRFVQEKQIPMNSWHQRGTQPATETRGAAMALDGSVQQSFSSAPIGVS